MTRHGFLALVIASPLAILFGRWEQDDVNYKRSLELHHIQMYAETRIKFDHMMDEWYKKWGVV